MTKNWEKFTAEKNVPKVKDHAATDDATIAVYKWGEAFLDVIVIFYGHSQFLSPEIVNATVNRRYCWIEYTF